MTEKTEDTSLQVNFRMPGDLKDRLQEASKANNRSLTSEIVARLDDSFDEKLDYQTLAEHALNAMQEATEQARYEMAEFRSMSSQLRLMRHLLSRVVSAADKEQLPVDLRTMIDLLGVERVSDAGLDILPLLKQAIGDMEEVDAIEATRYTPERNERVTRQIYTEARLKRQKDRFPIKK